jgi:hypothetical protein
MFLTITSRRYGSLVVFESRLFDNATRLPLLLYSFKISLGLASAADRKVSIWDYSKDHF